MLDDAFRSAAKINVFVTCVPMRRDDDEICL